MNEKDKLIVKDSLDVVVSSIPGLNIAWGLSKALIGAGLKLRQQKALEWVEMVKNNPDVFVVELLQTEAFQDGFVYALEKYLTERNENKRRYARKIFLDFSSSKNIDDYPLERFYGVLEELSGVDIETLKDVDWNRENNSNYQVYGADEKNIDNLFHLVNLDLLRLNDTPRMIRDGSGAPFVKPTEFGKQFCQFIADD
jgi:hypothetical protein